MTTADALIRWGEIYRFCGDDIPITSYEQACYVRTAHAGHGSGCLPTFAAHDFIVKHRRRMEASQ